LDGRRPTAFAALQLEHFFFTEHRNPFICIGLIAAFVDLSLITKTLGSAELFAGLKLAAIVGIYLLSSRKSPDCAVIAKSIVCRHFVCGGDGAIGLLKKAHLLKTGDSRPDYLLCCVP
jgi:hypothetical protein